MATKLSPFLLRSFSRPTLRQTAVLRVSRATYSSEAPPPQLLTKIKEDLKTAMRAKDTNRLAVLRSVLAATLNASKTDKPIQTNAHLVNLLHKAARKSQEAATEARNAGRDDLAEKEEAQQRILEEYAASTGAKKLSTDELKQFIESAKAGLLAEGIQEKALSSALTKKLVGRDAPLEVAMLDAKEVVAAIKEMCQAK